MYIQRVENNHNEGENCRSSCNRPFENLEHNAKPICHIIPESVCIGILSYSTFKELTNFDQAKQ